MADDSSLRKPVGGDRDGDDRPGDRKRKDPNDGDDYFQVENGDDGEIKGSGGKDRHKPYSYPSWDREVASKESLAQSYRLKLIIPTFLTLFSQNK
ncbi:hypothetical protein R6Q59_024548 [Mikania micrantha]